MVSIIGSSCNKGVKIDIGAARWGSNFVTVIDAGWHVGRTMWSLRMRRTVCHTLCLKRHSGSGLRREANSKKPKFSFILHILE